VTSVLLAKGPKQIVAVADGRLSRDDGTVSLDSTQKVRKFNPKYFIPYVSMGRFNSFTAHLGGDWCLSYAGTYTLANEITEVFVRNITEMYLDRLDDGTPALQYSFDRTSSFDDSYNFSYDERPKISHREVILEFKNAFQSKCDEWSKVRGFPDNEFLLFGWNEETSNYSAFKIRAEPVWHPGEAIQIAVDEIKEGEIATIGSPEVAGTAYEDLALIQGLKEWKTGQADADFVTSFGLKLDSDEDWDRYLSTSPSKRGLSLSDVEEKFVQIVRESMDRSVGGKLVSVLGNGTMQLAIKNVVF
jgi:hypothetical protein